MAIDPVPITLRSQHFIVRASLVSRVVATVAVNRLERDRSVVTSSRRTATLLFVEGEGRLFFRVGLAGVA
jgi:hypothetical protein